MEKCSRCGAPLPSTGRMSNLPFSNEGVSSWSWSVSCRQCGFCHWGTTPEDRAKSHDRWARSLSVDFLDLYSSCRGIVAPDVSALYVLRSMRNRPVPIGYCMLHQQVDSSNRFRVDCKEQALCCLYCSKKNEDCGGCEFQCPEQEIECAFRYGDNNESI